MKPAFNTIIYLVVCSIPLLLFTSTNSTTPLKVLQHQKHPIEQFNQTLLRAFAQQNLFLPIHEKDLSKWEPYLNHLKQLQFSAFNPQQKYVIFDWTCHYGLTSQLKGWIKCLMLSLYLNRTMLFTDAYQWLWAPDEQCGNRNYECYFTSISGLSESRVMELLRGNDSTGMPSTIILETQDLPLINLTYLEDYTIIRVRTCTSDLISRKLFEGEVSLPLWKLTYDDFDAISMSFFLSPNEQMSSEINQTVSTSMQRVVNNVSMGSNTIPLTDFDYDRTISMPVRWGDKCWQSQVSNIHGEMYCATFEQHMIAAEQLRKVKLEVDTIILTSESQSIIDIVLNSTNQTTNIDWSDWRFIINSEDNMIGIGNLMKTTEKLDFFDQLRSILSTIKLQMNAKYYLTQQMSGFVLAIWNLAKNFNIAPNEVPPTCVELVPDQRMDARRDGMTDVSLRWSDELLELARRQDDIHIRRGVSNDWRNTCMEKKYGNSCSNFQPNSEECQ